MTCVFVALAGWISPAPPRLIRNGVAELVASPGSAVFITAALICSGFHVGCACRTSAEAPALCGDAMEVPEMIVPPLPVPLAVDWIETPGAVTSGFRALSPVRGPAELKLANPPKLAFGSGISESVAVEPAGEACSLPESLVADAWLP